MNISTKSAAGAGEKTVHLVDSCKSFRFLGKSVRSRSTAYHKQWYANIRLRASHSLTLDCRVPRSHARLYKYDKDETLRRVASGCGSAHPLFRQHRPRQPRYRQSEVVEPPQVSHSSKPCQLPTPA